MTKLAGVPGWVLSASVAASATLTIGFTALTWFETGVMPDKKDMEKQAHGLQERLKEGLINLGKSKPSKKRVTEELEKLLPKEPPAEVPGDRPEEGPQS